MKRCAIYARYSTDKHDVQSIEAQLMMCRREVIRQGWQEVLCFTDAAESAATMHRPGMKALLAAVAAGGVDIVYADAMDRLSCSQADIATLFDRLRFRGIVLATRKEGIVTPLHIGMIGTINAEQLSATSDKTRDALVRRHAMGQNPGGSAYGYEKRIEHDGNGERIRGLQQIVPTEAAVVVRTFEDYPAGLSPIAFTRRINADGVPSPRNGKASRHPLAKAAAWTPNTLTGNAARGTGILDNPLCVGRRLYGKQTYRKNPETRKRHAFINPEEKISDDVKSPALSIVTLELWERVKSRQATLPRAAKPRTEIGTLPFFAQQRPKYLLSGTMICGSCGGSYTKSGKTRFGCQAAAKKGPTWCDRLTIRQDELDIRVLAGLSGEMLRDDVVAAFLLEYEAETRRLTAETVSARPEREAELANPDQQLSRAKAAILEGVDAMVFVEEMKIWTERRMVLLAKQELTEQETTDSFPEPGLFTPELSRAYREKVEQLTAAFKDEALKAQAFERLRALIEAVVRTPEGGDLAFERYGELASMLSLCAEPETRKPSAGEPLEVLQVSLVAGTCSHFDLLTHCRC
ncbi:DNA invertase Pin-like site-specific DNA recombinase [Sphingomonas faeni]|uniref:DNA invertase Pin-like site-specific DNA recombinase n=2 Tax=Sphingomonas faeni TaxID=185950 RepID=A0A2T5U8W4_9SPHN|nr:DNA invertase Pin-like site-specific DNA recombinase [Sphingomonas faeni]